MKFSITIPAYKQRYLYEAIESCLAQTYKDFELIIVDDASPEDLKSVVDRFIDDRIRYYRNEKNCGALNVVDNWNICLGYAKGDYVICMGDDDRLLPNCLEEYVKLIEKYPNLNVYHALTEIIDNNNDVFGIQEARPEYEGVFSMIYGRLNNRRKQFIGDWLFKRSWLNESHGYYKFPLAWGSDDLTAYLAAKDYGVANSQIPLFQYRVNPYTISNSGKCRLKLEVIRDLYEQIRNIVDSKVVPNNDVKEQDYRKTLKNMLQQKADEHLDGTMQQDIINTGKFMGFFWWLLHSKKFGISKKRVLKVWVKTLNK